MPNAIEQFATRQISLHQEQNPGPPRDQLRMQGDSAKLHVQSEPRHYTKLKIVSNDKGQSILFGWDSANARLTIWLPDPTPGKWMWTVYEPKFSGFPYVRDFDVISNHLEGRKDDTIDLVVMTKSASAVGQCLYFPALPFSIKQEDWEAYFSKPVDLTPFQQEESWQTSLGLLPKARRSVFIVGGAPVGIGAIRCDVSEDGQVTGYPLDLGPEWSTSHYNSSLEPCVAARQPASFVFDDGLVGSYSPVENQGVVKVMLPKTPLGDAWELTPLPPLGLAHWSTVTGIGTFRRADTGEPIITYVMSGANDSPLNKAVWVMDNNTLYHSDQGCWWLAAPPDQVFPPPAWAPVRALPVQMAVGKPSTWFWLQVGNTGSSQLPYSLIASSSTEFFNESAQTQWLGVAKYFEASLAASPTASGETVLRVFLAFDKETPLSPAQTQGLFVAMLDNASGKWELHGLPVPPPSQR